MAHEAVLHIAAYQKKDVSSYPRAALSTNLPALT